MSKDTILKMLRSKGVDIFWAMSLILPAILYYRFDPSFLDKVFPGMTIQEYKKLSLILSMYLLLSISYIVSLWWKMFHKIDIDGYIFVDGYYTKPGSDRRYCPKCLPDGIKSLLADYDDGPHCHRCKTTVGFD